MQTDFKIEELEAPLIDYLIARKFRQDAYINRKDNKCYIVVNAQQGRKFIPYSPSKEWRQGGPLLETYNISIYEDHIFSTQEGRRYKAHIYHDYVQYGDTYLLTAMRTLLLRLNGNKLFVLNLETAYVVPSVCLIS